MCAGVRIVSEDGWTTRYYSDSRKHTNYFIYCKSHVIDIAQMFKSCKLPKYYSLKYDIQLDVF